MITGTIFDIKEFAVYDGPGIRTTAFLKGCPLRCSWCHNPEGLASRPQLMVSRAACVHCGACAAVCTHAECVACGACIPHCRLNLRRVSGERISSEALAARLLKGRDLMLETGGGITFSGGEPLMQWDFVSEVIDHLSGVHVAVETSGYAPEAVFRAAMARADLMMMDVKQIDPAIHLKYTGVDNAPILHNARLLAEGDTPFILRVPLIPGVNDNLAHLTGVAQLIEGARQLIRVELLPYHVTAGAKYAMLGMEYRPGFDETRPVNADLSPFTARGIPAIVL